MVLAPLKEKKEMTKFVKSTERLENIGYKYL